jgi:hypothetical protein
MVETANSCDMAVSLLAFSFWRSFANLIKQTMAVKYLCSFRTLHSHSLISTRKVAFIWQFSYHFYKNDDLSKRLLARQFFRLAAHGSQASSSLSLACDEATIATHQ